MFLMLWHCQPLGFKTLILIIFEYLQKSETLSNFYLYVVFISLLI